MQRPGGKAPAERLPLPGGPAAGQAEGQADPSAERRGHRYGGGRGAGSGAGRGKRAKNGKFGGNGGAGGAGGNSGSGGGGSAGNSALSNVVSQDLSAYPKSAKALVDAARSRGTRVLLVHPGMSKRLLNTSHVADRAIHWKVYIAFLDTGFTLSSLFRVDLDAKKDKLESRGAGVLGAALEVHENTTLAQILEDFLAARAGERAQQTCITEYPTTKTAAAVPDAPPPKPPGRPVVLRGASGLHFAGGAGRAHLYRV
eukprot:CAMPEP_0173216028 /NCGR_PEP_ID=MMETSP1141-20130122/26801_1 /TAXON_ID=483371 /ORGANISM="non described non described, Strain CCMP2298" /LENGTH=255 /DNA_ID=CAMNT_0014143459 /DNA_START=387 /DNA_END=1150 /DNA_ORIENTATION=+